jgi:predicted transcriptional regulator YdeE
MKVEIINQHLTLNLYGFSGVAIGNDYAGTAFKLMDKMWQIVNSKAIPNKGINIWVYEPDEMVFAGVELYDTPSTGTELEHKVVDFSNYAYFKHIGPYHLIQQVGQNMRAELKNQGFETSLPYVEIYGHWTNDETKLETELLMALK